MIRRAAGCWIRHNSKGVYIHTAATATIVCGVLLSAAAEVCDLDTTPLQGRPMRDSQPEPAVAQGHRRGRCPAVACYIWDLWLEVSIQGMHICVVDSCMSCFLPSTQI